MKVKSYYSESVEAAVILARQELGPEAMLLNSRRATSESRHLGEYEVVFGVPAESGAPEQEAARPGGRAAPDRLSAEIADLRRQIERTTAMLHRQSAVATGPIASDPELLQAFSRLVAGDVEPEIAHQIVTSAQRTTGALSAQTLRAEIARRIPADRPFGDAGRLLAFVGPAGAGKTTLAVKVAVQFGIAAGRRVTFISADTERVGGADQLRTYAAILGAGIRTAETPAAIPELIREAAGSGLVLIDTPGYGMLEASAAAELANVLAATEDLETHLVCAASMKAADIDRVADSFDAFRPVRLAFTRIDETTTYGALLNQTIRRGKPISFLSTGQNIPDDVRLAAPDVIAELLVDGRPSVAARAAA